MTRLKLKRTCSVLLVCFVLASSPTRSRASQFPRSIFSFFSSLGSLSPDEESSAPDDIDEDHCEIQAHVGKFFNHSLKEEFRWRNFTITKEHDIEIRPRQPTASGWISPQGSYVTGLPLERHLAAPHHIVATLYRGQEVALTLPCTIRVLTYGESKTDDKLRLTSSGPGCLPTEHVVTMVISLRAQYESVSSDEGLEMIRKLTGFLPQPSRANLNTVRLEREVGVAHNAFMSGHGNAMTPPLPGGVNLAWPIACGGDASQLPDLDRVESSSSNGRLSEALGYDVIEWRVENRKSKILRLPSLNRKEIPAKTRHLRHGPEKSRMRLKRAVESSPGIPGLSPSGSDQFPIKLEGVPSLLVPRCNYFEYQVPADAFMDQEEGNTRKLKLSLVEWSSFNPLNGMTSSDSWLQLDVTTQVLFGVPPRLTADDKPGSPENFLLLAEDSSGQSATATFNVDFAARPRPINHRFTIFFSAFNTSISEITIPSIFGRYLTNALGSPFKDTAPPGHFTVLKSEIDGKSLTMTWFKNSIGSKKSCDHDALNRIWREMTDDDLTSETSQRSRPTKTFKTKFLPDFQLKYVKVNLFGPCEITPAPIKPHISTMAPPIITPPPPKITPTTTTPRSTQPTPQTTLAPTTKPKPSKKPLPSPPPITPPFKTTSKTTPRITTTAVKPTTTTASRKPVATTEGPPKLLNKYYTLVIPASVGRVSFKKIPDYLFSPTPFKYSLINWGDGLPLWVSIEPKSRSIVVVPSSDDTSELTSLNSTHKVWKGGLVGVNQLGAYSERMMVEVRIAMPEKRNEPSEKSNHEFVAKIQNYVLENFTSVDTARFLHVVCAIFRDPGAENVYVNPPRAGSVIFSWYNTSLSFKDQCPFDQIRKLGMILERDGEKQDLYTKFNGAGFKVSEIELKGRNSCVPPQSTAPPPTKSPRAAPPNEQVSTAAAPPGGEGKDISAAGGDGTTSIIIVAVVLVCVAILLIVTVYKCRAGGNAKRKRNEKKKLQSQVAAAAVIPPSSPYRLQGTHRNGSALNDSTLHFKPGTPIVFDGETSTTPMLTSTFSQVRRNGDTNMDDVADESIPLHNLSGADPNRPPPPAYVHK